MSNRSHDIRYALRMLANNSKRLMPRARARIATADRFGWSTGSRLSRVRY